MTRAIDKIINFIRTEPVLSISSVLAVISCFFVHPNSSYINYINWNTLLLLLVIMLFVEILKNLTVFEVMVRKLLTRTGNTRGLVFILVFICFISSIVITNDIALIIFVPFAILSLKKINHEDLIIPTVSLQTIAANVGCMMLPTGSPHNIVIYTISGISFKAFFLILLPYVILSAIFLIVALMFIPKKDIILPSMDKIEIKWNNFIQRVILGVDYYLLLTFIALFILMGNLQNIPLVNMLFKQMIVGNEIVSGILISQVISNVPSAMLLSAFSSNYEAIIIGINIGGFGTLVASMANLISFNMIIHQYSKHKLRYLLVFTALNIVLLLLLLGLNMIL